MNTQITRHPMGLHTPKGKQLCDLLRKELQVPDGVTSFSVHFAIDDVVRVECIYIPAESENAATRVLPVMPRQPDTVATEARDAA